MNLHLPTQRAVPSPCIGICALEINGLCVGCHRTGAQIARWLQMDDRGRLRLMEIELPARAAMRE